MKRLQTLSIAGALLSGALVVLSWSQVWFVFTLNVTGSLNVEVPVSGTVASPSLIAWGLLSIVISLVMLINSRWLRYFSAAVLFLAGAATVSAVFFGLATPAANAVAVLSKVTAISDVSSLIKLIEQTSQTAWPVAAVFAGILASVAATAALVTLHKWPHSRSKYDRSQLYSAEPDTVESWDRLSAGGDPTNAVHH